MALRKIIEGAMAGDLKFSKDVVSVTDCFMEVQHLVRRLEAVASSLGLTMNDSKREFMTIYRRRNVARQLIVLS